MARRCTERAEPGRTRSAPCWTGEALAGFRQETESRQCGLCGNNCQLTVNTFADGATFISGNRCDRPITGKADDGAWNLYAYKRKLILGYKPVPGSRGKIGLPLCLNFWELLPFWHTFFTKLGFTVYHSPFSSRNLYVQGQGTIQAIRSASLRSWPTGISSSSPS